MAVSRVFGPVPSRRLGRSLGINNIPPKICSYSCVYCQLGRSLKMVAERQVFYDPSDLHGEIKTKVSDLKANNQAIDYLTFVPDGEPTLDINLGKLINLITPLDIPIAVITNSTFLGDPNTRKDLLDANWISVKIDALDEDTWRKIDRPHRSLSFDSILEGLYAFSNEYTGILTTETMLVKDLNDRGQIITNIANFIQEINPSTAYLSIPTRPPAEKWVKAPKEEIINYAYQIFHEQDINTEYLIGYEGNEFAFSGNVEEDLLSITSVHPMREDAVMEFLKKADADITILEKMVNEDKIVLSEYKNCRFYLRRLSHQNKRD
jgi:wyosine [tRNA(Phe)-imidazoG37] synthetase (radical SAM superfamily)